MPVKAELGVNKPEVETPFPDQVPPAGENPVNENADALEHTVALLPAFTVGKAFTFTTT